MDSKVAWPIASRVAPPVSGVLPAAVSAPVRIRSMEAVPLDIPLHSPFGISGGAQPVANNVLVMLELADGTCGHGEAAPLPPYNGETQDQALAVLRAARAWVTGEDARDWRSLADRFRERGGGGCGSAQCAFETALLDALTRHDGVPLWRFFGGEGKHLETDMTVTMGSVEEAAAAVQEIRARGIRTIKVKIGGGNGARDLARLVAIHKTAPEAPLIIDGNAGLDRETAWDLVRGMKANDIFPAVLEQWLPKGDLGGMRELHEVSGWPVAADESVSTVSDARRVVAERAAQVINIKLMKAGIAEALGIVDVARHAGLELMIGGNVESILAMSMSACFAAGLGRFRFADLDTPLFLARNPFEGGMDYDGGMVSVAAIVAGHGVVPRRC
jgi:L-alanine-DL-glutamate epimerase-like enolase superfamily enzyme